MYKKMLFGAAALSVAFISLTAFGGKTLEQQRAEINQAIQTQIEAFRQEQKQACSDRVMAEAQTRYDAFVAEQEAAATAKKPAAAKKTVKKPAAPKADPLPQPTPPAPDPQKARSGAAQQGDAETQKSRSGAAPPPTSPEAAPAQKKRGGAVKQEGGN